MYTEDMLNHDVSFRREVLVAVTPETGEVLERRAVAGRRLACVNVSSESAAIKFTAAFMVAALAVGYDASDVATLFDEVTLFRDGNEVSVVFPVVW